MKVFAVIKKGAEITHDILDIVKGLDQLEKTPFRVDIDELLVEIEPGMPNGLCIPVNGKVKFVYCVIEREFVDHIVVHA